MWKEGEGVPDFRIPHSFFVRIPSPTFFSYCYPASYAQFLANSASPAAVKILRPHSVFLVKIPDPDNTLPDPVLTPRKNSFFTCWCTSYENQIPAPVRFFHVTSVFLKFWKSTKF